MNNRVTSTFTAVHDCQVVAIDNNLKHLLEQLYQRPVLDKEYMRAYRKKENPFEININEKIYTIKEFSHKNKKQNPQQ